MRLVRAHPILIPTITFLLLGVPVVVIWDALTPDWIYLYLRSPHE